MAIQEELDIFGYTNREMAEEADKNARAYLRKFEEFCGPLEGVVLQKFIDRGVKMFYSTGEGFHYFRRSLLNNCTKCLSKIQLAPVSAHV